MHWSRFNCCLANLNVREESCSSLVSFRLGCIVLIILESTHFKLFMLLISFCSFSLRTPPLESSCERRLLHNKNTMMIIIITMGIPTPRQIISSSCCMVTTLFSPSSPPCPDDMPGLADVGAPCVPAPPLPGACVPVTSLPVVGTYGR